MNWLDFVTIHYNRPAVQLPGNFQRRVAGVVQELHGTANGRQGIGERPDRAFLHPCAAGQDDRVTAEEREGGEEAEAGAGIFQIKRCSPVVRERSIAAGDDQAPVFLLDRHVQFPERPGSQPGVFGLKRAEDRCLPFGKRSCDERPVREALGMAGPRR